MRKIFITAFILLLLPNVIFAQKNSSINIAILPFYNYTDSGSKYLSSYIPELFKKQLAFKKLQVFTFAKSEIDLSAPNDNYYILDNFKDFSLKKNLDVLIVGRYLVQGKQIKINFKIIFPKTNKVIIPEAFDSTVDDRFLSIIEKFATNKSVWMKNFVFPKFLKNYSLTNDNFFSKYLNEIKSSSLGKFITNKWIFSLLILVLFFILSKIVILVIEKVLSRITLKTDNAIDEEILDLMKKPLKWIVLVWGIMLAFDVLELPLSVASKIDNISIAIIIIFVVYVIANIIEILITSWGKKFSLKIDSRIDNDLLPLFRKIAKIIIVSIGIIMVLSRFEIDIAPLIASLGIAGFAIGFAVKDSLANVIGGIVLILDRSFSVGDKVTIDGDTGVILDVGLRNTKLQTYDNEIIILPNGDLMNKKFKNSVLPDPTIRVVINFSVAYGTDVDLVETKILEAIKGMEDISTNIEPAVVFIEMGDFSLNFQAKFWVPNYVNQYNKKIEATKLVYNTLNKEEIDIPFPTHTVLLNKEE